MRGGGKGPSPPTAAEIPLSPADADFLAGLGSGACGGDLSPERRAIAEPAGSSPLGWVLLSAAHAPGDKSASMSQPLGNGNTPYRGVALIKVYFK